MLADKQDEALIAVHISEALDSVIARINHTKPE